MNCFSVEILFSLSCGLVSVLDLNIWLLSKLLLLKSALLYTMLIDKYLYKMINMLLLDSYTNDSLNDNLCFLNFLIKLSLKDSLSRSFTDTLLIGNALSILELSGNIFGVIVIMNCSSRSSSLILIIRIY